MLSGEIDLVVDKEASATLKAGDLPIPHGGLHTWLNRGDAPAVMIGVLIDPPPVQSAKK